MQLALFTPGACIWPVHRNFEAFVAELGGAGTDSVDLLDSGCYPVHARSESGVQQLSERMDYRLFKLHQDLYNSLLRPSEFFHGESRSFADRFWPDLIGTPPADLLSALVFHFIERPAEDCSVNAGLRVLRSIFFQHEMADPNLWVWSARENLSGLRGEWSWIPLTFNAPAASRLHDIEFTVHGMRERPADSSGWFSGQIRRNDRGECRVALRCGADRGMREHDPARLSEASLQDCKRYLSAIFGWQGVAA